jgi:redox-sensitive bicupin YhaK (pirin superfamily)
MLAENIQVFPNLVALPDAESAPGRAIVDRTFGHTRGPITRLMSPSDLGEVLRPFVFLDHAVFEPEEAAMPMELGWHPHSGIATITVMLDGGIRFAETTGKSGELLAGGIEFMRAGGGVWHTGAPVPGGGKLFQLWIALPPELENGPNASRYVLPEEVPSVGPARVILGEYGGVKSPIDAPPMTYLQVTLKDGERFRYDPPSGHTVAWVAVSDGTLEAGEAIKGGEMAVFERSEQSIDFVARGDTRFVLGSAVPHPHELHLGSYSVHTSELALLQGETEIRRIGQELARQGVLKRSIRL